MINDQIITKSSCNHCTLLLTTTTTTLAPAGEQLTHPASERMILVKWKCPGLRQVSARARNVYIGEY
jgi:hypothetical protein